MMAHSRRHRTFQISSCLCLIVALLACAVGCAPSDSVDRPQPALSGSIFEEGKTAVSDKDPDAILTSVAMQSFATSDGTPSWTYLYASHKYGKYYAVFNNDGGSVAGIYGDTRWNDSEWQRASELSQQSVEQAVCDADEAYKKVIDEYYGGVSSNPYRIALIVYDVENARNADSPQLMMWYVYIASQEKYDELVEASQDQQSASDALQEENSLGAVIGEAKSPEVSVSYENTLDATYAVNALTGEVDKL